MPAKCVGFIAQNIPNITVFDIYQLIIEAFQSEFFVLKMINLKYSNYIKFENFNENLKLLKSEDWIYNKTPNFNFLLNCFHKQKMYQICVEKGIIQKSEHGAFPINKSFYHSYLNF